MQRKRTVSITNNNGDKVQVHITVDFANCTDDQLVDWALSQRIIAGQKVWRELSREEIEEQVDGRTFDARYIGHKLESRQKQIAKLVNSLGVSEKVAEMILDNPQMLDEKVEE